MLMNGSVFSFYRNQFEAVTVQISNVLCDPCGIFRDEAARERANRLANFNDAVDGWRNGINGAKALDAPRVLQRPDSGNPVTTFLSQVGQPPQLVNNSLAGNRLRVSQVRSLPCAVSRPCRHPMQ